MDISKDIKDAIRKELPAEVGNVLQERIEAIDKLEVDNERLKAELKETKGSLEDRNDKLSKHRNLDERESELDERENDIIEREKKMEVHDAKLRAEEAEKRADLAEEYVDKVFRSPVFRTVTNKPVPVPDAQGYGNVEFHTEEKETTVE